MSKRAAIIGSGITGVLLARELLLAGWQVTVLEARHVGSGSSSRTAAGIRQQFSTRASVQGMMYCVDFYRRFTEETEDKVCPIVQNGYLFLYDDGDAWAEAAKRVSWQQSIGLDDVQALAGDDLRKRFGWVAEEMVGGSWCPSDGFLLPAVVYQEGANRVRALGGEIRQNCPVTGTIDDGDRIVGLQTPKGIVEADLFFDCTNAWTRRLSKILGACELPVDPLKRYIWFLKRDGPMSGQTLEDMPLVISPSGVYARPENAGSLLMGWKHKAKPEPEFSFEDQDEVEPQYSHTTGLDSRPYEAWMQMAEAIPEVGEFGGITATTAGYYGTTPDHNPYLGYDHNRSNLVRMVGFSGHGAMFGPFTARVGLALAERGTDVESVELPSGEQVDVSGLAMNREEGTPEAMVI